MRVLLVLTEILLIPLRLQSGKYFHWLILTLLLTHNSVLGGLLSSYYLSSNPFSQNPSNPDPLYLNLAADLGERLVSSFDQDSGLPLSFVNLHRMEGISDQDNRGFISTAEAASLQLEFKYLSQLLDDPLFWRKSEGVMQLIKDAPKRDGLVPIFIEYVSHKYTIISVYIITVLMLKISTLVQSGWVLEPTPTTSTS